MTVVFLAIIAPLQRALSEGGNIPSGLSAGDTWFHADAKGEMRLPGAKILAPDAVKLPADLEKIAQRYPLGATSEETRANWDQAIAENFAARRAPLKQILGSEGGASLWWNDPSSSQQMSGFKEFAARVFPNREFSSGLHIYSEDGSWERLMASLSAMTQAYQNGERLHEVHNRDVDLFKEITERLDESGQFIEERIRNNAAPNAVDFYRWQLQRATDLVNAELAPILKREMAEGRHYIPDENILYLKRIEAHTQAVPREDSAIKYAALKPRDISPTPEAPHKSLRPGIKSASVLQL